MLIKYFHPLNHVIFIIIKVYFLPKLNICITDKFYNINSSTKCNFDPTIGHIPTIMINKPCFISISKRINIRILIKHKQIAYSLRLLYFLPCIPLLLINQFSLITSQILIFGKLLASKNPHSFTY